MEFGNDTGRGFSVEDAVEDPVKDAAKDAAEDAAADAVEDAVENIVPGDVDVLAIVGIKGSKREFNSVEF